MIHSKTENIAIQITNTTMAAKRSAKNKFVFALLFVYFEDKMP